MIEWVRRDLKKHLILSSSVEWVGKNLKSHLILASAIEWVGRDLKNHLVPASAILFQLDTQKVVAFLQTSSLIISSVSCILVISGVLPSHKTLLCRCQPIPKDCEQPVVHWLKGVAVRIK